MWIRSQDRTILVDAQTIMIIESTDTHACRIVNATDNCYRTLGTYATMQKAMKVLDKINDQLESATEIVTDYNGKHYNSHCVFQMPTDAKVV